MEKHEHEILYLHCQNCLQKHEPSGDHEVSLSDYGIVVVCSNCGKIVFKAKSDEFKEVVEKIFAKGCSVCQEKN